MTYAHNVCENHEQNDDNNDSGSQTIIKFSMSHYFFAK